MINNILNIIANINARNSIITPSTTRIIKISMANAILPSITIDTGIIRCGTVATTITISVAVTFFDDCD